MKKYVKPEVVETKEYAEGVYLASGGRQIIRRDRKKLPVDLAERKQTRVRTPARSALRAAGREIRRFPGEESAREADFTGCIDGRPVKRS